MTFRLSKVAPFDVMFTLKCKATEPAHHASQCHLMSPSQWCLGLNSDITKPPQTRTPPVARSPDRCPPTVLPAQISQNFRKPAYHPSRHHPLALPMSSHWVLDSTQKSQGLHKPVGHLSPRILESSPDFRRPPQTRAPPHPSRHRLTHITRPPQTRAPPLPRCPVSSHRQTQISERLFKCF